MEIISTLVEDKKNFRMKGFYPTIDRQQTDETPLHQLVPNLDTSPRCFAEKHLRGGAHLGLAWLLKPVQNTSSEFHMLPEISVENLKESCNIGRKDKDTRDDGSITIIGPKARVSPVVGFKPSFFSGENYITHPTRSKQEGATSSRALFKRVRCPRGCSNGRGGLSLALAQFTATNSTVSSSQLQDLPASIDLEAAIAEEASLEGDAFETGMNTDTSVRKVSYDTPSSSVLRSNARAMMGREKQAKTSAELKVLMARLINKDYILTVDTRGSELGSGETEENVSKHDEASQEILTSTEPSDITSTDQMGPNEVTYQEVPPEFYMLRLNGEFRQHSKAKPILKPGGSGQFTNNDIKQSAPMDVPQQKPQHGQAAPKERYSYAYSMTEGVGRTLKGRDQREFRNHVLRLTGFIED